MDKLNEYQYLKKDKRGKYSIVYPVKDEHKKIIWKNFVGWRIETFMSLLILFLLLFAAWGYRHDTQYCRELLETPGLKDCMINGQLNFQHLNTINGEDTWNISIGDTTSLDTLHR